MLKAITIFALSFFTLGLSGAPACHEQQNKKDKSVENPSSNSGELKVLAQGSHSAVTDPFVAVIREDETYAKLRKLDPGLPNLEADFLRSNIVIAAFLGERNTGGYSVEISREPDGKIRVTEKAPGKGMMVPQVITSPFKVVSFEPKGSTAVSLTLGDIFQQRSDFYQISSGSFKMSGGFTGRTETFQLNGKLQVTRLGDLITIGFAMVSSGGERERSLRTSATGFIRDGRVIIDRMSYGSLIDPPSGELQAGGRFSEKNKLLLDFTSKPVNISDSYGGGGSIEAELVAASAM